MKKATILLSACTMFFASCTTTNKSVTSVPMRVASSIDPVKADYTVDVNSKLSGSSSSTWVLGFIKLSGDATYADGMSYSSSFAQGQEGFMRLFGLFGQAKVVQVKSAAAYNSISNTDADFIANPQYTVKQTKVLFGLVKTYDADVKGYKGKFTKIYQGEAVKK